jgi:hypothetical protein
VSRAMPSLRCRPDKSAGGDDDRDRPDHRLAAG